MRFRQSAAWPENRSWDRSWGQNSFAGLLNYFTASKIKKQFCLRNKKKKMKSSALCEDRTHDLQYTANCETYPLSIAPTKPRLRYRVINICSNIFQFFLFFLFLFFCPRVHQTQKLYQFINTGSSLLLPKRKYETNSATYFSAYNIYIYIYIYISIHIYIYIWSLQVDFRVEQCSIRWSKAE